jgi:hypothetical protein
VQTRGTETKNHPPVLASGRANSAHTLSPKPDKASVGILTAGFLSILACPRNAIDSTIRQKDGSTRQQIYQAKEPFVNEKSLS